MRIRHVALFNWRPGLEPEIAAVIEALHVIVSDSPGASNLQAGNGLGLSGASSCDFGLTVDFDDDEAYLGYRGSLAHRTLLSEVLVPAAREITAIQLALQEEG